MRTNSGILLSPTKQRQLKQFIKKVKDKREYRAAMGILMRGKGKSASEVSRELGVTKKQVFMWCRKFSEDGVDGLRVKKQTGRPAYEGVKAKKIIPQLIKRDPQLFGFLKGRWVLRDISRELEKEGVNLHYTGVRRALNDLGIVLKIPKLRAPGSIKKTTTKELK